MTYAAFAALLLLCGCASIQPPLVPDCFNGICVFETTPERARQICQGIYGMKQDKCFEPAAMVFVKAHGK